MGISQERVCGTFHALAEVTVRLNNIPACVTATARLPPPGQSQTSRRLYI